MTVPAMDWTYGIRRLPLLCAMVLGSGCSLIGMSVAPPQSDWDRYTMVDCTASRVPAHLDAGMAVMGALGTVAALAVSGEGSDAYGPSSGVLFAIYLPVGLFFGYSAFTGYDWADACRQYREHRGVPAW